MDYLPTSLSRQKNTINDKNQKSSFQSLLREPTHLQMVTKTIHNF